jgi:SulP family sulfate permease
LQDKHIPPFVTILRIHGPFLFGAAHKLEDASKDLSHFNTIVLLRLRNMTAIDGTGLHAIESFAERVLASGRQLIVCGARKQPAKLIRHSKLARRIGADNVVADVRAALQRAHQLHANFNGLGEHMARELST